MSPTSRRALLRGIVGTSAGLAAASLSACQQDGGMQPQPAPSSAVTVPTSSANPFGVQAGSEVEAFIFTGHHGSGHVDRLAQALGQAEPSMTLKVTGATRIAADLEARLRDGTPPDLVDNAGPDRMGLAELAKQLTDLDPLLKSSSLEGTPLSELLHPLAVSAGMIDDHLAVLHHSLDLHGLWYSKTLFAEHGWRPPTTWQEALELGKKAHDKGKYLLCWSRTGATDMADAVLASAIKQGGHPTRLALENLRPNCWREPAVQQSLQGLKAIIDAGLVRPDGATTDDAGARDAWAKNGEVLLCASGSWIVPLTREQRGDGFDLAVVPDLSVDGWPALGTHATHVAPGEGYVVPARAKNTPGAMQVLRSLVSTAAVTDFCRGQGVLSSVKGAVPADAWGDPVLARQAALLTAAGEAAFCWRFVGLYGLQRDHQVLWRAFLSGELDVASLSDELQHLTDLVRDDPELPKLEIR